MAGFETLNAALTSSSSSLSPESCKEDGRTTLDACYTSEQRDTILQLLNNATSAELADVKLLRGRKSLNIVEYRTKHGPFKTLESVVNVPLLKHKSAVIVFNSIVNPVKKERKVRIQLAKFIRPEVDRSWLEVRCWFRVLMCLIMTNIFSNYVRSKQSSLAVGLCLYCDLQKCSWPMNLHILSHQVPKLGLGDKSI